MDNKVVDQLQEIAIGDQVYLMDRKLSGEIAQILVNVLEIRHILGKQTYVVETEKGIRKVVGASQIMKVVE